MQKTNKNMKSSEPEENRPDSGKLTQKLISGERTVIDPEKPISQEHRIRCSSCNTEWNTKVSPERITICPFCGGEKLRTIPFRPAPKPEQPQETPEKSFAREYNRPFDLFEYSVEGGEICIRRCNQSSSFFRENLTVPETINGYPVTSIFKDAFKHCDRLVSVKIPEGVTKIGIACFFGCDNLEKAELPDSLETVSSGAFCNCGKLESIKLPANVSFLGGRAFENCVSLKSVVLPERITDISVSLFYNCVSLESIVLPDEIMTVSKDAFSGCKKLKKVVLPQMVTTIGKRAFYGCFDLESVYIPESVRRIGVLAFYACEDITVYSHTLTYAEEYAKSERLHFSTRPLHN